MKNQLLRLVCVNAQNISDIYWGDDEYVFYTIDRSNTIRIGII